MAANSKESFTTQALQIFDAVLVCCAFWIAAELRGPLLYWFGLGIVGDNALREMMWVLYIAVPFTPLVLENFGFYQRIRQKKTQTATWQLIRGIALIGIVIALIDVFSKTEGTRRMVFGLGLIVNFLLLLIRDRLTRIWMLRRKSLNTKGEKILIVGSDTEIKELLADLDAESMDGWNIVEHFDISVRPSEELFDILKKESIGRVLFAAKSTEFEKVAQAVEICELQGVEAWIAASFIRTQIARPVFDSVGSKPMLVLRSTPELSWELLAKEMIDRIGALILIVFSLPICILAAIGIRITSPGAPIMFSQQRAGKYGKPFRMWKFRTMVANAEDLLADIKKDHGNHMSGPVFKLDRDPRIFAFGALLRKLSIDELPQLLNVLKGEMSLVGPRPLPLYEVDAFCEMSHRRRLSVKPGITCEWQVGGRNKITSFEDWVAMDLRYIDNWSLWLDFVILLKTIPAVLLSKGAK